MTEIWTKWEGEVIGGTFPLRRFLSGSDRSGVFLTDYKAQNYPNAAIKIIAADPALADIQLSHWRRAATVSHPNLIRLLEVGGCQLGGHQFLFVVMEYAEETLSQILPHRALTPDEVRDMVLPTLDALSFLHSKNLVHGQLKPSNFLVVNDRLKLASDTVRPAGEITTSRATPSLYDPPEAKNGGTSAAGDIWALGITMVEALTQCPPAWPDGSETVSLPTSFPPAFAQSVRRCLSRNPFDRPTAADLEAQIKPAPQAPVVSIQPTVYPATGGSAPILKPPQRRLFVPTIAVLLIVLIALWAGLRLFQRNSNSQQSASTTAQTSSQQAASPSTASQNPEAVVPASPEVSSPPSSAKSTQMFADASLSVLHQEIPDVPRSASDTIRGHFHVAVRVSVDRAGNVVQETLENPGPSKYFAGLATAAAKKWKFAPTDKQDSREWLLRFEFSRGGITGHAASARS
jgi:serine/threonine protein kinase